jgi:aerobic carbon-monoxide dehydrogenase medium subunit
MIPAVFDYHRPQSVAEAAATLAELGDEAKDLAGCHSLLPLMKLRFASPAALVDIGDVAELRFVERDGDQVRVGALTGHRDLAEHPVIRGSVPLLSATAAQIGDPQIRNRGTIGGSIGHADPAGEYGTICLMLDAQIVTTSRRIPAAKFFLGASPPRSITTSSSPSSPSRRTPARPPSSKHSTRERPTPRPPCVPPTGCTPRRPIARQPNSS